MTRPTLTYVAGAYRAPTSWGVECNITRAREVAAFLWANGFPALCPHTNTAHFSGSDELFLAGTLEMLRRCDAVVLVPGWESSAGTLSEIAEAKRLGIPVYEEAGEFVATGDTAFPDGALWCDECNGGPPPEQAAIRCLRGHQTLDVSRWGNECRECRIEALEGEIMRLRGMIGRGLLGRAVETKHGTALVIREPREIVLEYSDGSRGSLRDIESF